MVGGTLRVHTLKKQGATVISECGMQAGGDGGDYSGEISLNSLHCQARGSHPKLWVGEKESLYCFQRDTCVSEKVQPRLLPPSQSSTRR
jgi:hypothetical protein